MKYKKNNKIKSLQALNGIKLDNETVVIGFLNECVLRLIIEIN